MWNSALQECGWNGAAEESGRVLRNNAPNDWLWKSGSVGLFQGHIFLALAQWFRADGTSSHGLHDLQIAEEVNDLPLRHPWLFHRSSTEAHAVR